MVKRFLKKLQEFKGIITGSAAVSVFYAGLPDKRPFKANDIDFIIPAKCEGYAQHIMYSIAEVLKVCYISLSFVFLVTKIYSC